MSGDIGFIKPIQVPLDVVDLYRVGSDCSHKKYKKRHYRAEYTSQTIRCDEGDFEVDRGTCSDGSPFLICGRAPMGICPTVGEEQGTVGSIKVIDEDNVELTCTYSRETLNSDTVISDYQAAFGQDEQFASLLQTACFMTTEDCPTDPLTGQKMPLCSKYVSPTSDGMTCRQQALLPGNQDIFEAQMENYCRTHTTPDCRCIDRTQTQIYDSLRTGNTSEDGCWWKWCANTTDFIVPPNVVLGKDPNTCPAVLQKVANEINQNLDKIECCQIQQNVIYAPDGSTPLPVNCFFTDALILQKGWFERYGWWILLIVIIFVIVVGIAAIWASSKQDYQYQYPDQYRYEYH